MKILKSKISKTVFVLILITLGLTSCCSDEDSNQEQSNYYLFAKIDDVDFSTMQ